MRPPTPAPNPISARVPLWLPMGFMTVGLFCGLLLLIMLAVGLADIDYVRLHPRLLTIVHLFTLGFGSAITMGALYQMAPVVLVTPLHSATVGWWSLGLYAPGTILVTASFSNFYYPGLALGASFVVAGAALFVYNMVRTWANSGDDSLTRRALLPAVFSFFAVLLIGFTIACMWQFGFRFRGFSGRPLDLLGVHVLLGTIGWFTAIIVGVSYRLVGMFRLVHGHDERMGGPVLALLYGGVAVAGVGSLMVTGGAWIVAVGLGLILAGTGLYARDFNAFLSKGIRPPDGWMRQVKPAIGYLVASVGMVTLLFVMSIVTNRPMTAGHTIAIGLLFGLGWVGNMIIALLHKIVPFLVWYHRYSGDVGHRPVPLMKDLVNEARGTKAFRLYHVSVLAGATAAFFGWHGLGGAFLLVTTYAYGTLIADLIACLIPDRGAKSARNLQPSALGGDDA